VTEDRLISADTQLGDVRDRALRPLSFGDFVGQASAIANLKVYVEAAKGRGEPLDHLLLSGPPGLGKTTLSQIVARELGVNFRSTSGPIISKAGDLAALLTNLEPNDVLFIDEIHRLNPVVEEVLYPAMEDFELDLIIGDGPAARSIKIDIAPFTLIGATTRAGLLATPLRSVVDAAAADAALKRLGVDDIGLDKQDMRYLHALCEMFGGGPTGADTLAAALSEARDALEDVIEPYLIQQGFLQRTPRGRMATPRAYAHLGLNPPASPPAPQLFEGK